MSNFNRWLIGGLLTLLLAALAWGMDRTAVIYEGNIDLSADAHQRGDLVILSGNVSMPASARVDGSLLVLCCNVDVYGAIGQDLYLTSGNLRLGSQATVGGEIGTTSANVQLDPGAAVAGRRAGPGFWLILLRTFALVPALALIGLVLIVVGLLRGRADQTRQLAAPS